MKMYWYSPWIDPDYLANRLQQSILIIDNVLK